jgi:hypothetical protein
VVFGEEHSAFQFVVAAEVVVFGAPMPFLEAGAKLANFGDELLRLEDLVWEGGKCKVEVVFNAGLF